MKNYNGTMNSTQNRRERFLSLTGFTLLEILLVVVIVAIIVTVASPRFQKTLTTIQLANTAQDIAQLMRYLKVKANSEKVLYQLKLDLPNRKYFAQKITSSAPVMYDTSKLIPSGIHVAATSNIINFFPDGSMDQVSIYVFRGDSDYSKDMEKMIQKEFSLGQVQSLAHTEYVYTITTQPSIGKVKVTVPE